MHGSMDQSSALLLDPSPTPSNPRFRISRKLARTSSLLLVIAGSLGLAIWAANAFRSESRNLWYSALHDRNAHYSFGLNIALNVRNGYWSELRHDLDSATVWGILHGLLMAGPQLASPGNIHLAILPSLAGWILTVVFGFLVARRMVPCGGNLAGWTAALFILASPGHRAFATDVMLESLGAGLTMVTLYLYLRTIQGPLHNNARTLAICLSLLFFLKSNYYMLVLFSLLAAEFSRQPRVYLGYLNNPHLRGEKRNAWLWAQFKQPLNYAVVILGVLALILGLTGGQSITLFGRPISVRRPHNLLTAAYFFLFLRVLWGWRRNPLLWKSLSPGARQVVVWHVLPLALWFLLPKRLGHFLWYMGPTNGPTGNGLDLAGSLRHFSLGIAEFYHLHWIFFILTISLAGMTYLAANRLRLGSNAVLWFLALSILLTVAHPNRKIRNVHSWVATTWVVAGAGLALVCYPRRSRVAGPYRHVPALAACLVLGTALGPGLLQPGRTQEGGPKPDRPTFQDITDAYLPTLAPYRRTGFICQVPLKFLTNWSFLERYPDTRRVETELEGFSETLSAPKEFLRTWLAQTSCDSVVFLDIPRHSRWDEGGWQDFNSISEVVAEGNQWKLERRWEFEEHGCNVNLYVRQNSARAALP